MMLAMFQCFSKKSVLIILVLLGALQTALYGYGHFIDGDVIQILEKAHLLVTQDILIPYGNVSSSGASGNIPGAFLTLISGLPMKIWFSPWAALTLLGLLHFVSFLFFSDVLFKSKIQGSLVLSVLFFWLNPWRMSEVFLWNPGYIFLASALHMWSAFHLSKDRSFTFSIVHGLSLFLGLQIHPSFIILFFMTMILLWTKALKAHLLGTLCGIVIGFISLTPYILAGIKDPSIFPQPGGGNGQGVLFFGLVAVYPLLKGFWYWILFGSSIFQTHIFHQMDFSWIGSETLRWLTQNLWVVIKYTMGIIGVGLSFFVNYQFYKKHQSKMNILRYKMAHPSEWLSLYAIAAFFSALIATGISPTLPIYWHLLYIWPMSLIPLIQWLSGEFTQPKNKKIPYYLVAVCFYFLATNLLGALGSKKHDIHQNFHDLYFKACLESCSIENLKKENP